MKKDLIFLIFGSTGDLTARKLLPAITRLYNNNEISKNILVLALGRREYNTKEYLDSMQKLTKEKLDIDVLEKIVRYYKIQITNEKEYTKLAEFISEFTTPNTKEIYYLAIGPDILTDVAKNISTSTLIEKNNEKQILVFEKPFGYDLKSARAINSLLMRYYNEKQIYRIDHYLGKEMIQNIMTVRFANRIFEDTWDNKSIMKVRIHAKEEEGILSRAGYYDSAGALRDMVQSHLLQIISLIAMDIPREYNSTEITKEKLNVLNNLKLDDSSVVFGQYEDYLNEENIPLDSKTETFIFFKVFVNTPRFKGVPFEVLTGKKLDSKDSFIEVIYYPTSEQEKWNLPVFNNKLIIRISPNDGVDLSINSKKPGLKENLELINLSYQTAESVLGNIPEAYEKLLLDIVNGSKTLFTSWDEVEASWKFIDQIKQIDHDLYVYDTEDEICKYIKDL